ncbi:TPA: hypothetical protein PVS70_004307, partial [Klebsiella pneumoniae]|nr:hypothetical protein [Klebsiella pneumoniae]
IPEECYREQDPAEIAQPIGGKAVIHSHNTLPSMSQKYRAPIWKVPFIQNMTADDRATVSGNRQTFLDKQQAYSDFADALLVRIAKIAEE